MTAKPRGVTRLMLAVVLLLQCGGCLVGPDFSELPAPVASKWLESNNPSVISAPLDTLEKQTDWDWWTVFHDPVLDRLIRVAYEQNLSLVSAGTRVLQARAELGVAIGEFLSPAAAREGLDDLRPAEPC